VPLSRVEAAGGTVLLDKMSICDYGFIAYFLDTEGNKVAIHSMSQQFLETYKYAFGSIHIVSFI